MDFIKPGPNKRVCAFLIDSIIGEFLGFLISFVCTVDITWIIWFLVILFKDCFHGQGPGKYIVGIQIVDEKDLPAKPSKTILRNAFMIIPLFPIIEYVRMLRDKNEGKRIGDNVAKTKVRDLSPQKKDSTFLWISIALAIVIIAIKLGIGMLLLKQHPELFKK